MAAANKACCGEAIRKDDEMKHWYRCYRWGSIDWQDLFMAESEAQAMRRDGWYCIPQ